MSIPLRLIAAALLGCALPAAAGEPKEPPPLLPPGSGDIDPNKIPALRTPQGYEQCPICKNWHPPGFICCCPVCGSAHPRELKCRPERAAPRREALCPVCAKRFDGPLPFRRNAENGFDRDFCRHALGSGVVEAVVWMCPRCGYTRFSPARDELPKDFEFNKPLDPEMAQAIRAKVEPVAKKALSELTGKLAAYLDEIDQTDIPDWMKYQMALLVAEVRGASAAEKAKFAIEGCYAARRMVAGTVNLPDMSRAIVSAEGLIKGHGGQEREPRSVLKAVTEILAEANKPAKPGEKPAKGLTTGEEFYFRVRLAGAYDRLGERALAADQFEKAEDLLKRIDERLKTLKDVRGQLKPLHDILAERRRFLDMEIAFRAQAIANLRKALLQDGAYAGPEVLFATYQLGELYRRQEDYARARTWLTLAAKLALKEPTLAAWADDAMSLPGMRGAEPLDDEERTALAFVEKLIGKKPELEPSGADPKAPAVTPTTVSAAPKDCAECLANVAKAYAAYVTRNGKAPADLPALVADGFITGKAANDFKCPATGAAYVYRPPRQLRGPEELLIFHRSPKTTACKKLLFADGTVKDLE